METVVIIQMLSQLLPTLINILTHYEELVKNGNEQDKEKMKVYLDTLKWKSWDELKKEAPIALNTNEATNAPAVENAVTPAPADITTEVKKEVENAPAPANTNTAAAAN